MNEASHSYRFAGLTSTNRHKVGAIDHNRPGGSGEPPLPARRAPALRYRAAFTLVELLIATGITVAIVLMLGLMLSSLLGTASHTTERVDAFRDARAAMQMIERDLRNLVRNQWSPDPFTSPIPSPCTASTISTTRVTLPAAYFALDYLYPDPATGNQQLYALVSDKTTGSSGDVCAVGYYCRWDAQLHAYSLRRFFRDSAATFAVMQAKQAAGYAAGTDLYAPGPGDPVLAAYVWNLKITVFDAAGSPSPTPSPPSTPRPCVCDQPANTPNGAAPTMLPAAIEISFNAMSPQAARAVMSVTAAMADSTAAAYWMNMDPNLVRPHAYQFRSRINLP